MVRNSNRRSVPTSSSGLQSTSKTSPFYPVRRNKRRRKESHLCINSKRRNGTPRNPTRDSDLTLDNFEDPYRLVETGTRYDNRSLRLSRGGDSSCVSMVVPDVGQTTPETERNNDGLGSTKSRYQRKTCVQNHLHTLLAPE